MECSTVLHGLPAQGLKHPEPVHNSPSPQIPVLTQRILLNTNRMLLFLTISAFEKSTLHNVEELYRSAHKESVSPSLLYIAPPEVQPSQALFLQLDARQSSVTPHEPPV